jgi:hypothetical protein
MDVTIDDWTCGNIALFTQNDLWSIIQKSGSLYKEHTSIKYIHITLTERSLKAETYTNRK